MAEEAQPFSSGSPTVAFQARKQGRFLLGHHHAVNHPTAFAVPDGQKAGICPEHLALPATGAAQPGREGT